MRYLALASLFFGCFGTASAAEECYSSQPIAANVDPRGQAFFDWDADPDAQAYCQGVYSYLELCPEPSLDSGCGLIFRGKADLLSVRVDAFAVTNGLLFGRILTTSSCGEGEPIQAYIAIKGMECTFRP